MLGLGGAGSGTAEPPWEAELNAPPCMCRAGLDSERCCTGPGAWNRQGRSQPGALPASSRAVIPSLSLVLPT